jgi:hypothetical protein
MESAKVNLLYIASSGRSGSTLLELLFGAHSQFWTMGEFYVLPFAVRLGKCGCGIPFQECSFWGPILKEMGPTVRGRSVSRFRDGYEVGRLLHFQELPFLWTRGQGTIARRNELNLFGRDNSAVLSCVLRRAREIKGPQVTWLVDASKSLYRLLWLKQSAVFNLRVIHLVKDPRSFVYSISKTKDGSVSLKRAARATVRWNTENYLFDKLFRNRFRPDEVLRIRYEKLASDTELVLKEVLGWLNLPYNQSMISEFRNTNHGIAGNPMRQRKTAIQMDEKWRQALSPAVQRLVRGVSLGLSKKYGY